MFGELRPDLGGAPNPEMPGYLVDATAVRMTPNGYRGVSTFADVTSGTAIGAGNSYWIPAFFETIAARHFFVLNAFDAKIYESTDEGVTWADSTPAAGAAVTVPGDFFTYENDVIYACAARAPIKRAMGVAAGTDFSNLGGSPPTAICGAQVRQHVVLGGLPSVDYYAVQWSAIDDHEDWPTPGSADALSKESGREKLPQSLGIVRQVLGGEKIGIVVQEQGLTRMTYEGGNTVYSFDTYETKVGYGYARSSRFANDGRGIWYWYNDSGFYATDGYSVNRLDDGKIEDTIFNNLLNYDSSKATLPTNNCLCAYDPHRHLVVFGNQQSNYQLTYDPRGWFTFLNQDTTSGVFAGRAPGLAASAKLYGHTLFNVNKSNRKLQMWSADGGSTSVMQTGYIELSPGRRVQLQGAHLIGTEVPGSLTLTYRIENAYSTMDLSSTGFTSLTAQSRGMKSTARADGQFFAFRITGAIGERHLIRGVRVFFTDAGPSI